MSERAKHPHAPYGIDPAHCEVERYARFRTPLAAMVFIIVLGSALLGWLGGGSADVTAYVSPSARVVLEHEPILRSGNWFETVLTVTPARNVKDLVMAVDQPLWRGMSIDTLAPDAESAEGLDGTYSYHFGAVKAGERLRIKFDGQIQPRALRFLKGDITLSDDGVEGAAKANLIAIPLSVTVLP
jgi:hypothetical protein